MMKYELKKLLANKFVLAAVIVCAAAVAVYAGLMHSVCEKGRDYSYEKIALEKGVLSRITVTKDNIADLEKQLDEIESSDASYGYVDADSRLDTYFGKHTEETTEKIKEIYGNAADRELTQDEQRQVDLLSSYQISDEVFPEYYSILYAVQNYRRVEYCTTPDYFRSIGVYVNSTDDLPPEEKAELNRDLTRLENGITTDRNFGWQELLRMGSVSLLPVLIAALISLSSAAAFSGEYESGMYQLLVSSKNGRRTIIKNKLAASLIFTVLASLFFDIFALVCFSIFFSPDGAFSDSSAVIFGNVANMAECFLLMVLFTLAADIAIALTSLAASVFCSKMLTASGISLLMILIPLIFGFFSHFNSYNINGILDSLPVNIPLVDFGISAYSIYTKGNVVMGAYNILAPFIPVCLILSAASVPLIFKGWKNHRIEK